MGLVWGLQKTCHRLIPDFAFFGRQVYGASCQEFPMESTGLVTINDRRSMAEWKRSRFD